MEGLCAVGRQGERNGKDVLLCLSEVVNQRNIMSVTNTEQMEGCRRYRRMMEGFCVVGRQAERNGKEVRVKGTEGIVLGVASDPSL